MSNTNYWATGTDLLSEQAQNNIIDQLRTFYNLIDFEFWLIVADRPVDISVYMSQLHLLYNQETLVQCRYQEQRTEY